MTTPHPPERAGDTSDAALVAWIAERQARLPSHVSHHERGCRVWISDDEALRLRVIADRLATPPVVSPPREAEGVSEADRAVLAGLADYCARAAVTNDCCDSCTLTWQQREMAILAALRAR